MAAHEEQLRLPAQHDEKFIESVTPETVPALLASLG